MHNRTEQRKYFIPAWVLESDMPSGHKLILSILNTRSRECSDGCRVSANIGAGVIADLIKYSYLQVSRALKDLTKKGYIVPEQGGYRILGEPLESTTGVEELVEEPTTKQEPAPEDYFASCWSWDDCKKAMRAKGYVTLRDIKHSYNEMVGSAPHRNDLYQLMIRLEDKAKEEGLDMDHRFSFK